MMMEYYTLDQKLCEFFNYPLNSKKKKIYIIYKLMDYIKKKNCMIDEKLSSLLNIPIDTKYNPEKIYIDTLNMFHPYALDIEHIEYLVKNQLDIHQYIQEPYIIYFTGGKNYIPTWEFYIENINKVPICIIHLLMSIVYYINTKFRQHHLFIRVLYDTKDNILYKSGFVYDEEDGWWYT